MSVWSKIKRPEILVIIALLKAEQQGITELQSAELVLKCGISKATLKQSLTTLEELGLIEQRIITVNKKSKTIISLTDRGRRIAEKFIDIESELLKVSESQRA